MTPASTTQVLPSFMKGQKVYLAIPPFRFLLRLTYEMMVFEYVDGHAGIIKIRSMLLYCTT